MPALAKSTAFAHLPNDIIFDVLEIGCPKFEDLVELERTKSRWTDVIRSGKSFARGTLSTSKSDYLLELYDYGITKTTRIRENVHLMENWNDLLLTDVTIRVGSLPVEFEERIFRHATRRVLIYQDEHHTERAAEIFEILATRPITDLTIYWDYGNPCAAEASFRNLLSKPFLQHLSLKGYIFQDLDLQEALLTFVKRPNFLYLCVSCRLKQQIELLSAIIEHWMQLTVFPTQMQGVSFARDRDDRTFLYDLGFRNILTSTSYDPRDRYLSYKELPTDASKRIEVFMDDGLMMELCLTSKEASVGKEFGEYENFQLHKRSYLNSTNYWTKG